MTDWIEHTIERVENVIYLAVAVVLFAIAAVVIGKTVLTFGDLGSGGVVEVAAAQRGRQLRPRRHRGADRGPPDLT